MEKLALPLVILSILLAAGIVLLRRYWLDFDFQWAAGAVGLAVLAISIYSIFRAKKYFESRYEAFVRLESHSGLHSSLTAAQAGKSSWPKVPNKVDAGIRWNFPRLLLPIFGSLCLLLASFTVPVKVVIPEVPGSAPRAWDNLAADLGELKEKELVQDEYIREIEDKLGELKDQPEQDWYSHPSLEATENLRQSHRRELDQLSNNLNKAEKSLNMLKQHSKDMTEAQRSRLMDQFDSAMEAMEKGRMKPNKDLLDKLKDIDPKMLNNLTPEQLEQLREQMRNMSDELKKQLRDGLQPGDQLPDSNGAEGGREQPINPDGAG